MLCWDVGAFRGLVLRDLDLVKLKSCRRPRRFVDLVAVTCF